MNIRDNTGVIVSGTGHLVLIGWALLAPFFQSSDKALPVATTEVSLISAEEFAALSVPQDSQPAIPRTEITPPAPVPSEPAETALSAPVPESEPAVMPPSAPAPAPAPPPEKPPEVEAPPAPPAEVADTPPDSPAPPSAEQVVIDAPPSDTPTPRAVPRVAPRPAEPAPPEAAPADTATEEVRPDPEAEAPVPETEAAAPPEATTEIVTEAEEPASAAPRRSLRPRVRPERPAPPVEMATPQEPAADAMAEAIAAAVQDANNIPAPEATTPQGETVASAPAAGPPLSRGEKDSLRVTISRCWNVGSLSSGALATTVVVAVSLSRDGRPKPGTIRMLSASGGTRASARQAFEAARRAILRCGAGGYDLPIGKYEHWRDIEITFNPEKMRIK